MIQVESRCFLSCFLNAVYVEIDLWAFPRLGCGLNLLQNFGALNEILNWCLDVRVCGRSRLLFIISYIISIAKDHEVAFFPH